MKPETSTWHHWLHNPKRLWFRKALFQTHLWAGISLGLRIMNKQYSAGFVLEITHFLCTFKAYAVSIEPDVFYSACTDITNF